MVEVAGFSLEILAVYSDVLLNSVNISACSKQVCFICNVECTSPHNTWKCGEMPVNFIKLWQNCSAVFQKVFSSFVVRVYSSVHQELLTFWIYNALNGLFISEGFCYCTSFISLLSILPFHIITFYTLCAHHHHSLSIPEIHQSGYRTCY